MNTVNRDVVLKHKLFESNWSGLLKYVLPTLLATSLVASSFVAVATDLGIHKNLEGAIKPETSTVSGRPVLYFSVSKYKLAEIGATLAHSVYNSFGNPVIFYDEKSLAKLPKDFQRWIFAHELEHFKLGHFDAQNTLYQKSLGFKGVQISYEQAADCAAVRMLKHRYFLSREGVIEIAQTALHVFKNTPLQRVSLKSSANYSHQFMYAEAIERAKNIIACYENE